MLNRLTLQVMGRLLSYSLSNHETETVFHPEKTATMLFLFKYPGDFAKAQGLNQLWTIRIIKYAIFMHSHDIAYIFDNNL